MTSQKQPEKQNSTQDKLNPMWDAAIKSVMRSEPDFILVSAKNVVVTQHVQQD